MAQKYADFLQIKDFLPVYDITAEMNKDSWKSFIPTKQFCDLLRRALTAITSPATQTEASKRKGVWVRGTFGTGKSHASAVVKHLLCDPIEDIADYLPSISDSSLQQQISNLREDKRYFPVVIKGVEGAYDVPRFKLCLQRETKRALRENGINDIVISSDYEVALQWIDENEITIQDILQKETKLHSKTPNINILRKRLQQEDMEVFMDLDAALEKRSIHLNSDNISNWLVSVEKELQSRGQYEGIIIFWDEFTSVMDTIKSDRIGVLQNIAEACKQNNIFLYLISHRVERTEDALRMGDRFDNIDYRMDEVSTYMIMRHTFSDKPDSGYDFLKYNLSKKFEDVINYLSQSEEEKDSISKLFPLHPYTAYLCSRMSDLIGSANRSVVSFMHEQDRGFLAFINDDTTYTNRMLLTADRLWDFFEPNFSNDPKSSLFVQTLSANKHKVEDKGDDYLRVFKAILLLNAITSNLDDASKAERLTPNQDNIERMFAEDRIADKLENILNFFDETNIISRNVLGEFKINVSSFNPTEIQNAKKQIALQYKTATSFLDYNTQEKQSLLNRMDVPSTKNTNGTLYRPCRLMLISCETDESQIRSMLRKYAYQMPNSLHIALFLAINEEDRDRMQNVLLEMSSETDMQQIMFVIPEEVLGFKASNNVIDLLATKQVAHSHFNTTTEQDCEKQVLTTIRNWMNKLGNGTYLLYLNGETHQDGIVNNISRLINQDLSRKIFSSGFETVKQYRNGSTPMSFYRNGGANAVVKNVIESLTRDKLTTYNSSNAPLKYVFEYRGNNLLDDMCLLRQDANQEAWLVKVCAEVDKCMAKAREKYRDRFSLSEVLAPFVQPPFGFFQMPANFAAIAYALRKYKEDLFIPSTAQPITEDKLEDMVALLVKIWDDGNSNASDKLYLRFGSPEESKLTMLLKEIFALQKVNGVNENEIKSYKYARWAIQEFCKARAKQPLWTIKYSSAITEDRKILIEALIKILEQETPSLQEMKQIVHKIDADKVDLHDILSTPENYQEGFENFLNSIDGIEIKEEWKADLLQEISLYLPTEIAFWKEIEVENQIRKYVYNKTKPKEVVTTPITDTQQVESVSEPDSEEVAKQKEINITNKKREAKECIKNKVMPNSFWQLALMEMIDAHPEISDYIIQNLK